ncbi:hypothetical protein VBD025_16735 [Virgibacillus flavescens]|uniref:hypothetical protein n=1 Tax=Virgibacillus flavescens TaxID=1611422 RepID=UPI003D339991
MKLLRRINIVIAILAIGFGFYYLIDDSFRPPLFVTLPFWIVVLTSFGLENVLKGKKVVGYLYILTGMILFFTLITNLLT